MSDSIIHDRLFAEHEALERSKRHKKPIAAVWHTQVYAWVLMDREAAQVCFDAGTGIKSQSFIADAPYLFVDFDAWTPKLDTLPHSHES